MAAHARRTCEDLVPLQLALLTSALDVASGRAAWSPTRPAHRSSPRPRGVVSDVLAIAPGRTSRGRAGALLAGGPGRDAGPLPGTVQLLAAPARHRRDVPRRSSGDPLTAELAPRLEVVPLVPVSRSSRPRSWSCRPRWRRALVSCRLVVVGPVVDVGVEPVGLADPVLVLGRLQLRADPRLGAPPLGALGLEPGPLGSRSASVGLGVRRSDCGACCVGLAADLLGLGASLLLTSAVHHAPISDGDRRTRRSRDDDPGHAAAVHGSSESLPRARSGSRTRQSAVGTLRRGRADLASFARALPVAFDASRCVGTSLSAQCLEVAGRGVPGGSARWASSCRRRISRAAHDLGRHECGRGQHPKTAMTHMLSMTETLHHGRAEPTRPSILSTPWTGNRRDLVAVHLSRTGPSVSGALESAAMGIQISPSILSADFAHLARRGRRGSPTPTGCTSTSWTTTSCPT